MISVKGAGGGGAAKVTNAVSMEAVSREGEIKAGTFANVDIEFDFLSEKEDFYSSSRTLHDVIQLDEDRYFVMCGDASSNYAQFAVYSNSLKTYGTTITIGSSDGNSGIIHKMDDGRVLAITGASSGNTATVHLISIDELTITIDASTVTSWVCDNSINSYRENCVLKQISENKFLYVYGKSSATAPRYAVVFIAEGNTISQGTSVVLNTTYQYHKSNMPTSVAVMDENHFVVGTCLTSSSSSSRFMPEVFYCSINGLEITVDKSEQLFTTYQSYYGECLVLKTNNRLWLTHYTRERRPDDATMLWDVIKIKLYEYSNGTYNLLDEASLTEINGSWTSNVFRAFTTNENILFKVSASDSTTVHRLQLASEENGKIVMHMISEVNTIAALKGIPVIKLNEQFFVMFAHNTSMKKIELMPVECIGTTLLANSNFTNQKDSTTLAFESRSAFLFENNDVIIFGLQNSNVAILTTHLNVFVEKYFTPTLPLTLTKTKVNTTSGEVYLPA